MGVENWVGCGQASTISTKGRRSLARGTARATLRPWRAVMGYCLRPCISRRAAGRCWLVFGLVVAVGAPGCHHEAESRYKSVTRPLTVQLVQPQVRDLSLVVGQPGFIE